MNHNTSESSPAEEQAALWAARIEGSVLSKTDRAALEAWLAESSANRDLLSSYCQLSDDLGAMLPHSKSLCTQTAEIRRQNSSERRSPWLRWSAFAGTALAAAALAFTVWPNRTVGDTISVATASAHRQTLSLSDGTTIDLNAQTSVSVDLNGATRLVRLSGGEAFFSVAKDTSKPFIVETPSGSVRVTGTRFNVRSETSTRLDVTVAEGTVIVRPGEATGCGNANPTTLTANTTLTAADEHVEVCSISSGDLERTLAWRTGQIIFQGDSLRDALLRFARYHGRDISVSNDAALLKIGGRYSLEDLDGFFASLEEVLPVRATRDLSGAIRVELRNEH